MLKKIKETVEYINKKIDVKPEVGIILGTGLGNLSDKIDIKGSLKYSDIPNFPKSTVEGHRGELIFGKLNGKMVVAMAGRFHFYEGYSMQELAFPVRVMKFLGIELLVVSNASGGMNPDFKVGDIMIINDHINLMPSNPLIGANIDELGPRFPDMSDVYDKNLINKVFEIGKNNNINLQKGVYAAVSGPCFETPAEYNYIRTVGADAVGMSTVPEVIVARHMGLSCFALSVITDLGVKGKIEEITHEEVIEAAKNSEPIMTELITKLLESL